MIAEFDELIFGLANKMFHELFEFAFITVVDGSDRLVDFTRLEIINEDLFGFENELVEDGR